jgi:hypothetical protein
MKLSFWTIIIMAISIAVGILSFAIFHQTIPTLTAANNYVQYRSQLETEAGKENAARKRVEKALATVSQKTQIWNGYVATRTPTGDVNRGGINLAVNPYQLTVDTQKFRNSVQRAVNAQIKRGGVTVVQAPSVPGPASTDDASLILSYYNYPGLRFPVVIFDLGPVTVTGTYQQIMANVRSYKTMPRYLAVTDGLQINGTSPHLTGTYNLSIVGFIRGKDVFPPIAGATAAGATAGPGGFPGGPPGMMGRGGPASFGPPAGFGGPPPGIPGRAGR